MAKHNILGKDGEDAAVDYLVAHGYTLHERDWRVGHMDLDIIAEKDGEIVFVEVKTRQTDDYGSPEDAVTDKKMRNNGFMKGPNHYSATPGSSTSLRTNEMKLRRIMVSADMDPDKTYYIRFKNVLDADNKQFYMDYIEYCAKEVYDNPEEGEDIW